jgi:type II secretory pathway pseudopilin PulG
MMKNYLKPTHRVFQQERDGFTLIELLIAASLSIVLMLIATYGLSIIVRANQKSEGKSLSRNNLNRALEFISDEVKTAKSLRSTAPVWASGWTLGGGSPQAKLYLEIPLHIESVNSANKTFQIKNHGLTKGDAITFTAETSTLEGLGLSSTPGTVYYVVGNKIGDYKNSFQITNTLGGTPITLGNTSGQITVNRLVIYYIREGEEKWLKPRTVYRSISPCKKIVPNNCIALIDSISKDGFNVTVNSPRKVEINLTSQLTDDDPPLPDDTEKLSAEVFARPASSP